MERQIKPEWQKQKEEEKQKERREKEKRKDFRKLTVKEEMKIARVIEKRKKKKKI